MDEGELATLLRDHALRYSVPGAAVGILRNGATTTACYGVTNVATADPVTPETRFSVGSLTESMVATVIARLADTGLLSLDDPPAAHVAPMREVHTDTAIHGWLDAWCLGWARFDWEGGPVWGWDGLIDGERSVVRLVPQQQAAVVLLTNSGTGRGMYRTLFADPMDASFGIRVPPRRLDPVPGAAGDLSRFAGVCMWPDRRVVVTAAVDGLRIASEEGEAGPSRWRGCPASRNDRGGTPTGACLRRAEGRPATRVTPGQ